MDKYYFEQALTKLRAAMDNNDSGMGEAVDLIYSLEDMRAHPHIPRDALVAIEKMREVFLQNVAKHPEIALQAYKYGKVEPRHSCSIHSRCRRVPHTNGESRQR